MTYKRLINIVKLIPEEIEKGSEQMIELEYYLLENDHCFLDENNQEKTYGVEIVKKKNEHVETQTVKNLTHRRDYAYHIIHKLSENVTTPMELTFILDDLIGVCE